MLTDMYQISMTYAHWKNNKVNQPAVFDLFFRKNPFHGEYCIFAGQDEVIRLLSSFKFLPDDVKYLQTIMPTCEPEFFAWLLTLDCSEMRVYSMEEGSVSFVSAVSYSPLSCFLFDDATIDIYCVTNYLFLMETDMICITYSEFRYVSRGSHLSELKDRLLLVSCLKQLY